MNGMSSELFHWLTGKLLKPSIKIPVKKEGLDRFLADFWDRERQARENRRQSGENWKIAGKFQNEQNQLKMVFGR